MITFQVKRIAWFTLKKELRRSDFLFEGGYVGARVPLLSTSKNKKELKIRVTQFHTILKIRLLSFETNVRGANIFLKRKYNSRTWNILFDRFPSVFPTFSTNKRWWRLRAFSSFGKRTREPRLARPQKGRLRHNVPKLRKLIFEEGHRSNLSNHPGATKMYHDLKIMFWWPNMKREVSEFVYTCLVYRKAKIEHQRPSGKLRPLEIPQWKWDNISMDFVVWLPWTPKGFDSIWVIVDRLTKSAHFIPINIRFSLEKLTSLYISEIVILHSVSSSIMSNRDPRFTSRFWESLNKVLGTKLRLSSTYHH